MKSCEQMPGLSVYAHGEMVHAYYKDLEGHVCYGKPLVNDWKLPDWIRDQKLWSKRLDDELIREYQIFHDCGKPGVRTQGGDGKVHFPNHAQASETIWRDVGGLDQAARLMGMDMDIHLLKAEDQAEFAKRIEAATLLITGFCEIHANASMFGGLESTSFKIKWKHIDKRGKQICKLL